MAYSTLPTKVASDTLTLTNYNNIRDDFIAGVPDIFTTKGDLAAATAADAAGRVAIGSDDDTLVADSAQTTGMIWVHQPAARVYNNANIDPTVGVWTTLTFNSERFDTDAMHSISTNTDRITVPTGGGGLYLIGASVEFDTSGLGTDPRIFPGVLILLNGTTVIGKQKLYTQYNEDPTLTLEILYELAAEDYVTCQVYIDEDVNVLASGNYSPEFWAIWQRRA